MDYVGLQNYRGIQQHLVSMQFFSSFTDFLYTYWIAPNDDFPSSNERPKAPSTRVKLVLAGLKCAEVFFVLVMLFSSRLSTFLTDNIMGAAPGPAE